MLLTKHVNSVIRYTFADLIETYNGFVRLAGNDIKYDGQWTWSNGTPFGWTNWLPGNTRALSNLTMDSNNTNIPLSKHL